MYNDCEDKHLDLVTTYQHTWPHVNKAYLSQARNNMYSSICHTSGKPTELSIVSCSRGFQNTKLHWRLFKDFEFRRIDCDSMKLWM